VEGVYYCTSTSDTDHYLVVVKVRERLAVNKQRSHGFHTERFNLMKLNKVEVKIGITLRCQAGLQLWKNSTQRCLGNNWREYDLSAKDSLG
jgi:hypothetical protein